jgi:aryl-alcohol dehydrogenase-like predicted oxidoreductase
MRLKFNNLFKIYAFLGLWYDLLQQNLGAYVMIPQHTLGNSNIKISAVGLGTVKFGRNQGVKYPKNFTLPSDQDIEKLLSFAKDLGVNFLDTAPAYGTSEERLGQWLKKTGQRSHWVIASKFGEQFINGVSSFDFSKKETLRSVDNSLKLLQTEYLDMLLVHSNGNDTDIINNGDVFATLQELKTSGKIRAYGMSTKTVEGGLLAAQQSDVVMVTYNPIEISEQLVIAEAHKLGKGILIKKAFASGHLDKISKDENPIKKSIEFIFQEPGVTSIVIGTLNSAHLKEAIDYTSETLIKTSF